MSQEIFWILLSKKLSGEASPGELGQLENLILQHPEWQYAIQNLEDLWQNPPTRDIITEEDAYMLHLQRMQDLQIRFGQSAPRAPVADINPPRSKRKWYWAAAILLAALGTWTLLVRLSPPAARQEPARQVSEITTRPGSTSRVELPDGSMVWLNAGSKLTYTRDFGKKLREVSLSGEGYFDVTRMKDKPFIIHTANINIRVLGTAFNVKAYPEDKKTETSLIHGSIEVTINNRPDNKIILSPSEKLVVENEPVNPAALRNKNPHSNLIPTLPVVSVNKLWYSPEDSTLAETDWMSNRLIFRDESFDELAVRMERRYGVEIEIANESLKDERLNGIFETESVSQALEALKEMIPFKYERKGDRIFINR